jgi:hypothetical protein
MTSSGNNHRDTEKRNGETMKGEELTVDYP